VTEPGPPPEPGRDLVPVDKPPDEPKPGAVPGVVDLVARSARVGIDTVGLVAGEVASASVRIARAVLPPAIADRPLDAVGGEVDRRRDRARMREEASREEAVVAMQAIVRQVVDAVIEQVDMDALVDRIPVDKVIDKVDVNEIAARIDVDSILERVDIGSIVRESTTSLAGETVDAIRVQAMGADLFAARVVDKILFRKKPRDLELEGYDVTAPEYRTPKVLGA
jgi:hypothetical protein